VTVLDAVNRPFRRVGAVWRAGLGLAAVLLLIALLAVILARIVISP
jgi:hypothetical protein